MVISWILRNFKATRAAWCSACGEQAEGELVTEMGYEQGSEPVSTTRVSIHCENCGKCWNIRPHDEIKDEPTYSDYAYHDRGALGAERTLRHEFSETPDERGNSVDVE